MTCSAHRFHVPLAPACDSHHVIPRAWQLYGGGTVLWDKRTVELCPNCHRGVHERLVAYMRRGIPFRRDRLSKIAEQAVIRYAARGGNLDDLRRHGLYGQQ